MPILWEWVRNRDISKSLEFRHDGLNEDGSYGDVRVIDTKKPILIAKFEGRGFSEAEADAIFTEADVPAATYTLTDYLGYVWTGIIQDLSEGPVKAGCNLKTLSLTLANATKTPP